MISTWKDKDEIELAGNMANFVQYVQIQSNIVIYMGEPERYLKDKLGKRVNFQRVFREWQSDPERQRNLQITSLN